MDEQQRGEAPEAPPEPTEAAQDPERGRDPRAGTMSMVDYTEAMTDRNVHARKRGLSAPYIAGGRDPEPDAGLNQDRFYLRLLLAMVLLIVVGGLVLSIAVYILTGGQLAVPSSAGGVGL